MNRFDLMNAPSLRPPPYMLASRVPPNLIRAERIVELVARHYHLQLASVTSKSRLRNIVWARHVAIWLCMKLEPFTVRECSRFFRSGETYFVNYALKKVEDAREMYPAVKTELDELEIVVVNGTV